MIEIAKHHQFYPTVTSLINSIVHEHEYNTAFIIRKFNPQRIIVLLTYDFITFVPVDVISYDNELKMCG